MNNIDIAIIGAGSAGSIIANKLLTKTNFNIALIEAGPKDNNPIIDVPLGTSTQKNNIIYSIGKYIIREVKF